MCFVLYARNQVPWNPDVLVCLSQYEFIRLNAVGFALSELVSYRESFLVPEAVGKLFEAAGQGNDHSCRLELREFESKPEIDRGVAPLTFIKGRIESDLSPVDGRLNVRPRQDHLSRHRKMCRNVRDSVGGKERA